MEKMQRVFIVIDHDFERFTKIIGEIEEDERENGESFGMVMELFEGTDAKGPLKKAIMHCL